jgi:hypothetical protein
MSGKDERRFCEVLFLRKQNYYVFIHSKIIYYACDVPGTISSPNPAGFGRGALLVQTEKAGSRQDEVFPLEVQ